MGIKQSTELEKKKNSIYNKGKKQLSIEIEQEENETRKYDFKDGEYKGQTITIDNQIIRHGRGKMQYNNKE